MTAKIGRNDPCHCGSGQKYKKCHLPKDDAAKSAELAAAAAAAAAAAKAKADAEAEEADKAEKEGGAPAAGADRAVARTKDAAGTRPRTPAPTQAPAFRRKSV
jgi:hypothetical protein